MATATLSRRQFIRAGAAAGGGLLLSFYIPPVAHAATMAPARGKVAFAPNAFIRLRPDGQITMLVGRSEMGQGVLTSLPMILADEMDADWKMIHVEQAPATPAYANPVMHINLTGGSSSVRGSWMQMRHAGATARAMLIAAAAKQWKAAPGDCHTKNGEVTGPGGKRASYGALAQAAAKVPVPAKVTLKQPAEFRLIGRPIPRVDTPLKVNGTAVFGIDVKLPGMKYASVARCPVFGGKPKAYDITETKKIKGVHAVVRISNGIAVVGDHFWAAKAGRDALKVKWDYGPLANLNSAEITKQLATAAEKPGNVAQKIGEVATAQAGAAKKLEAVYQVPYLAHATMEPMNCTADVREDRCDIYAPTQGQTGAQRTAAQITGLPIDKINVVTTFLGGGFGRRGMSDFVADAVGVSKSIGKPVKVIWTREEDMQHDFYRPVAYNSVQGGLDGDGRIVAWSHHIVSPSIHHQVFHAELKNGIDPSAVEGAVDLPYAMPNFLVDYTMVDPGVPITFWRSVGHSFTVYVVESFIDELAAAAGKDPYQFRLAMLEKEPRYRNVLKTAAEKAGWGKPLPKGIGRGIALAKSFNSYVAEVAEVSVDSKGAVKVHRVVAAIDCGTIVNPDTIEAQVQSAIVYGLSAALSGEITLDHGRVQQSNFNDYPVVRIDQMPKVEVYPIAGGGPALGGLGEPGTPPIAPAVTNAIFALTGKRIRSLPIRAKDLV